MQQGQVVPYIYFKVYNLPIKQEFIDVIKTGRVLTKKCIRCNKSYLSTIYFCKQCGSRKFENHIIDGKGYVETFTIVTVPPTGFEKYIPYAWVVMKLDNSELRLSGFMENISGQDDIPIGTKLKITYFDERGIIIKKQ